MIEPDIDDTHLCIKCSETIVGLENYIQHRKHRCSNAISANIATKLTSNSEPAVRSTIIEASSQNNLEHAYEPYTFVEPEPPSAYASKTEHGKTSKSLSDSYDLPYELGADVFFSSLQLQSVQSTAQSTSGKTGSVQRQKSGSDSHEETWIEVSTGSSGQHSTDTLMKAVNDISDSKKSYEVVFKSLNFVHESPDPSEDEEEEDDEDLDVEIDEEDDEFEAIGASSTTGGKWKPTIMRHSPPVVPVSHTGGKWKPENRPNLRVTHSQLTRLSPNWEEPQEETEALEGAEHPPSDYTKGKWIPGTKLQHLDYNDKVELKKSTSQEFWCNICCRRLRNKHIYENHLKTTYHLKRAEPEQQLERATLGDMSKNFVLEEPKKVSTSSHVKRKRRVKFLKCELCKLTMMRHLLGKHLISHYHFRRMQLHPGKSLRMILDNIHSIVLQAPFQCRPCSFYANTEETFLQHWNSPEHLDASEGPGRFWCSFCHFECEDNNQMRRHLLSTEHTEVLRAINRSVPICISKKLSIDCNKCGSSFRYNIQLRKHSNQCHPEAIDNGTASDVYQSRFPCEMCSDVFRSKVSLQRHEKNHHSISKYFCTICKMEFDTPCKARRHRKSADHRYQSALIEKKAAQRSRKIEKGKRSVFNQQDSKKCKSCDFVASSEVEAMLHELNHSRMDASKITDFYPEPKSNIEYPTRNLKLKTISKEMKCKDCEEIYKSHLELKQHRDEAHPYLKHVCTVCGQSFALAQVLGRHTRHCKPVSIQIEATNKVASEGLNDIVLTEESQVDAVKSWCCKECNFSASFESDLIFHRLHHTLGPIGKNQQVACPLCSKSFRKQSLRCHLRQHTKEKIFACTFCDTKFARNHNLKSHIKVVHQKEATVGTKHETKDSDRDQECASEESALSKKYILAEDKDGNRQTEKRFGCSFEGCHYLTTSNSILKVHMNSHAHQTFKCDHKSCSYVGRSALHLKRHTQLHTEPKKLFRCDKCDFKTKISTHLKRHLHLHTGEKPYKCPHCDFSTALHDNLRKHILKTNIHPGKFVYECQLCKESQSEVMTTPSTDFFRTNSRAEYQTHLVESHNQQN